MTASDSQALRILGDMVKEIAQANATAHREIMNLIHEVEVRLCAKIENNAKAIQGIETTSRAREEGLSQLLKKREETFEAHICQAREMAVAEATQPSIYRQALTGLSGYVVKLAIFAGTCFGIALAIHRLWFGG